MSAIAGHVQLLSRRADRSDVWRMLDRLKHCGPDGTGIWSDEHVALGHCMLQTTPESVHETLPLHNPAAVLTLTCDARIDNRQELIRACGLRSPERDVPDSDLILAAYEKWGESCVENLLGDFSFAIWDGRKRQLFCARDPFGIRPFFYYYSSGYFVFASQIKALFSIPGIPRSLNESRIGDHLLGFCEDRASTFFHGIFRLPPAHTLTLRANDMKIRQYWSPDPSAEIRRSSDAEYAEEFRAIFAEAVHCRLRSVSPIGSTLSGGLDSSSIACMARNQLHSGGRSQAIHTFSGLYNSFPETDERFYIESVLESGGFIPHFFDGAVNPLTGLDTVLGDLDEVFHETDLCLMRMFYQSARQEGVRVMLDGLGGDQVVSHGTRYLGELLRTGSWSEFGREAFSFAKNFNHDRRTFVRWHLLPYFSELKRQRRWLTLGKAFWRMPHLVEEPVPRFVGDYAVRPLVRKLKRRLGPLPPAQGSIISDEFAGSIDLQRRHRRLWSACRGPDRTAKEAHYNQFNSGRLWITIEEFGRLAAPCCVEPRYPQLDKRLVEFCLGVPSNQKLSQGWSRAIFRRAMNQVLPEEVRWRGGKAVFLAPFADTLREHGREFLDATILRTPPALEHYFNLPVLRDKYQRFLAGDASQALDVWRASDLIWWLESSRLSASPRREASISA